MGLETGTYISDLNASNPVDATDLVNQGDDHLRLVKGTLLNTFPNITGAMTLTHTQLNNAAIKTESSAFTVTDAPDLVDNGNALNVGTLAGAHLAFGPAQVQAKGSATTTATLTLNALGGIVQAAGDRLDVLSTLAPALDDNTNALNVGTLAGAHLAFGPAAIQGKGSASTVAGISVNSLGGNVEIGPQSGSGYTRLWNSGAVSLVTQTGGVNVVDNSGADPFIGLLQDDGSTRQGYLQAGVAGVKLVGEVHGAPLVLQGEDIGGVLRNMFIADPDDASTIYHAGTATLATTATGILATGTVIEVDSGASSTTGFHAQNSVAGARFSVRASSGDMAISRLTAGGGEDAFFLYGTNAADVALYYNGIEELRTADHSDSGASMGAEVRHSDGSFYEVGMNVAPPSTFSVGTSLSVANVGHMVRLSGASAGASVTATTNAAPSGATWLVYNSHSSALTITQGSGMTLNWLDGAGGATGSRTLAADGICTIMKRGSADFYIWGIGLS